jgi:hypothetical protein
MGGVPVPEDTTDLNLRRLRSGRGNRDRFRRAGAEDLR